MTIETIKRSIGFTEQMLSMEGIREESRVKAEATLAYEETLLDAFQTRPIVTALIEVQVAIRDDDWTVEDLLANCPDYFVSAITDAEVLESKLVDEPSYVVDATDLTFWLPTPEVLAQVHGLEEQPLTPPPTYLVVSFGTIIERNVNKARAIQVRDQRREHLKPEFIDNIQVLECHVVDA